MYNILLNWTEFSSHALSFNESFTVALEHP